MPTALCPLCARSVLRCKSPGDRWPSGCLCVLFFQISRVAVLTGSGSRDSPARVLVVCGFPLSFSFSGGCSGGCSGGMIGGQAMGGRCGEGPKLLFWRVWNVFFIVGGDVSCDIYFVVLAIYYVLGYGLWGGGGEGIYCLSSGGRPRFFHSSLSMSWWSMRHLR